jgi:xanthine dehydrogenase YagR molybdenum-binding subunit
MRAPGHPQNCVLTDCPVDDLAAKLGLDPLQVRLKNLPPKLPQALSNDPHATKVYGEELKIAAGLAAWDKKWHPPGMGPQNGPIKHGIGMAMRYSARRSQCCMCRPGRSTKQDRGPAAGQSGEPGHSTGENRRQS